MSIYDNIYNLINTYVFGNTIVNGSYEELVTILISTLGCLFLVGLPFIVVYLIIKLVLSSWR